MSFARKTTPRKPQHGPRAGDKLEAVGKVESSDETRIREMQEAHRRAEVRNGEASQAKRAERSFRETMGARSADQSDRAAARDREARTRSDADARRVLDQVRNQKPQLPHERAKREALAQALGGKAALVRRRDEQGGDHRVLLDRTEQHQAGQTKERRAVEDRLRDEDGRDQVVREERQESLRNPEGPVVAPMEDDRRRRRDRSEDERRRESEALAGVKSAGGSAPVVPPELLEKIVGAVTQVIEDGRSHLRVRLEGAGLDGVELEVKCESSEVRCTVTGCSDRLRRDLEGAAPALGQALGRRGFRLSSFEVR